MAANHANTINDTTTQGGTAQSGTSASTKATASTARTDSRIAEHGRSDQERSIETSREQTRSAGVAGRERTAPVYRPSAGGRQFTPFTFMQRMAEDMDRLFENFGFGSAGFGVTPGLARGVSGDLWGDGQSAIDQTMWSPQVETFRVGNKLVVRADLPGLKKEDVKVEIENGVLSIFGERCEEHEDDRDDFYRSERSYGQFYRAVPLPEGVGDEHCEATFKDGVLEVTLPAPKEPERRAKQIQVR